MPKTIKIANYLVAFIDIVGQRDKLKQLVALPRNETEEKQVIAILEETSEYVKQLRVQFNDFFNRARIPSNFPDRLTPKQREWLEERKKSIVWHRGFSDSYTITIPCCYDARYGVHLDGIYSCLYGLCTLFLWSLAMKNPFRGGVEVSLGTEIAQQEVYGPVTARAYELENKHYPCVFVGDGLLTHLDKMQASCPNDLDGRHTLINIKNYRDLITTDNRGNHVLDPMGEGVKAVPTSITLQLVKDAYYFVVSQEELFSNSGNDYLRDYYSELRTYCESRLSLWDINALK